MKNTMKKILCTLLVIIMCLTSAPLNGFLDIKLPDFGECFSSKASAVEILESGYFDSVTWKLTSDGVLEFSGNGELTEYVSNDFENQIDNLDKVKTIYIGENIDVYDYWTLHFPSVKEFVVSDNHPYLSAIGGSLLNKDGTELLHVAEGLDGEYRIPSSVKELVGEPFTWCKITELYIHENVSFLGYSSYTNGSIFYGLNELENINVASGNKWFSSEDGVLFSKYKNKLIAYPGGKRDIYYKIPETVNVIQGRGFAYNLYLQEVVLPGNLNIIPDGCFSQCENLSRVVMSDNISSIGDSAFSDCKSLKEIVMPKNLSKIGERAFGSNTMTNGVMPYYLEKIYYPYSEEHWNSILIGEYNECIAECKIVFDVSDNNILASGYCGENAIWELTEDGRLTISGEGDMYGLSGWYNAPYDRYEGLISSVYIGEDITYLSDKFISPYYPVSTIEVSENNKKYKSEDGVLYSKDGKHLVRYPICKNVLDYTISDSVEYIDTNAFNGAHLRKLVVSDNVKEINSYPNYLESIVLGKNVKNLPELFYGYSVFIESITISSAVTSGWFGQVIAKDVYFDDDDISFDTVESILGTNNFPFTDDIFKLMKLEVVMSCIGDVQHSEIFKDYVLSEFNSCIGSNFSSIEEIINNTDEEFWDELYSQFENFDISSWLNSEKVSPTLHGHTGTSVEAYADLNCLIFECKHEYDENNCCIYCAKDNCKAHEYSNWRLREPNSSIVFKTCSNCGLEKESVWDISFYSYGYINNQDGKTHSVIDENNNIINNEGHLWQSYGGSDSFDNEKGVYCSESHYACVCGVTKTEVSYHEYWDDEHSHKWGEWIDDDNGVTHTKYCVDDENHFMVVDHIWDNGVISKNSNEIIITYSCISCGATKEDSAICTHSGGTATCEEKAICEICGEEYGEYADHIPSEYRQEASCEVNGYILISCEICLESLDYEILTAPGHDWDEGVVTTVAKCNAKEVKLLTCKNDSKHTKEVVGSTDPDNHIGTTYLVGKVDGDCTTDGYTGDTYCSGCDVKLSSGTVIIAEGHKGGIATCQKKAVCTVCKNEYGNLGSHTPKTETKAATCTEGGYELTICTLCRDELSNITKNPFGHSFGDWNTEKEATLLEVGSKSRKCVRCPETETETIPCLKGEESKDEKSGISVEYTDDSYDGKDIEVKVEEEFTGSQYIGQSKYGRTESWNIKTYVDGKEVQPGTSVLVKIPLPEGFDANRVVIYHVNSTTGKLEKITPVYVEDGYIKFLAASFSVYIVVDESSKHEHNYSSATKDTTCTEKGYTTYTCSCGDSYVGNYVNAKGHKDNNGDYKCDNGCGYEFEKPETEDPSANCSCNCHKGGFMGFIWKIINFFNKLFKNKQKCSCGVAHY